MEKFQKQATRRSGGSRCSAGLPSLKSCTNTSKMPGISLHHFPRDPTFRRQWTQFVRRHRKGFNPSIYKDGPYLCSKHFEAHCFTFSAQDSLPDFNTNRKRVLYRGAVPSIFDPQEKENQQLSTRDRRMVSGVDGVSGSSKTPLVIVRGNSYTFLCGDGPLNRVSFSGFRLRDVSFS